MLEHDAAELWIQALKVAGIFFWVLALALVPVVLLRRKEPSSTIAWILALVFLPVVGTLLFLMFGRDRVRWPAKRKMQLDAAVRAQLAEARTETDDAYAVSKTPDPTSALEQALFRVGAQLTHGRPTRGNKVDVLTDGNAMYDALGAAIDGAKHHVHAQYYLIRDDATGAWFRDRLAAAAKRGVAVRLLMDGFGCFAVGSRWQRPLRQAGAKVGTFLPMRSLLLQPVNLRNHRKIVVVDGELAFTGGFNIGDEYRGQLAGVGAWRDLHLRIEGPAAGELQRVFFQDWAFATGEAIAPQGYFPACTARGDATVAIVPSGPDTRTEAIHRLFFGAIAGAQREVLVTTPYFVPTESLVVAMEVAAMRGVDVKLMLAMPGHSNHTVTLHAGRSFYTPLLEAGVHVLEYELGMVHAKTLVADGQVSLVGSANMDLRSFRLNFEVHALVHDPATALAVRETFGGYEAKSHQVELDAWQARSWTLRLKEGAARLVSPML